MMADIYLPLSAPMVRAYQERMIAEARRLQGDHYIGDEYYQDPDWENYEKAGIEPEDAVTEDMSYWDE